MTTPLLPLLSCAGFVIFIIVAVVYAALCMSGKMSRREDSR